MTDRPSWLPDTKGFIAIAVVGAFVAAVFIWMMFPPTTVDQAALTVINMLLGALVAKFGTVVDFNFGSSQGSKDKDDAQNKVVEKLTTGTGNGAAVTAAAEVAAVPAAKAEAPKAAKEAAPPAAAQAAPPAVDAELDKRGIKSPDPAAPLPGEQPKG